MKEIRRSPLWSMLLFSLLLLLTTTPATTWAATRAQRVASVPRSSQQTPKNMTYHQGPVMTGTMGVYAIFWEPQGSSVNARYNSLLRRYYADVGGTALYGIMHQYTQQDGSAPTTAVLAGSWVDTGTVYPGKALSQTQILAEVKRAMKANSWVAGPSTYFPVYTAQGIASTDAQACGYHSSDHASGIIYAHLIYPAKGCEVTQSPNGCLICDSAISTSAHEQFEAATDPLDPPDPEGWYYSSDATGEMADLCEPPWYAEDQYGPLGYDNGKANQQWNGHFYLIQEMWDNSLNGPNQKGGCSQGQSQAGTDDWPMSGYDPAGTGYNSQETILSPSNVKQLVKAWSQSIASPSSLSPGSVAVVNGVLYVGSTNTTGNLYAFNASTGSLNWKYATGAPIQSAPAVVNGVVYITATDGILSALDAKTGTRTWHYSLSAQIAGSPVVTNDIVYVSGGYSEYAFDASTGKLLWQYSTFGAVAGSPAVANGIVYVTSQDETLYALNANTGKLVWEYYLGALLEVSPTVANGVVYVGSEDGNLYVVNATTGKFAWQYTTGGSIDGAPAVANGVIYVIAQDRNLYAINASTHKLVGKYSVGGEPFTSPAVANGVVYVSAASLYALDATSVKPLWSYLLKNSDVFASSPTVANGAVYAVSLGGTLYAFHL